MDMNKLWAGSVYSTSLASSNEEGWIALELTRQLNEKLERVARVIFWDADGQFYLEMFLPDAPLSIIEALIAESKATIRVS